MSKKKKRPTSRIINPAERDRERVSRANELMQKAWDLIYSEDKAERQRRLENSDISYSRNQDEE